MEKFFDVHLIEFPKIEDPRGNLSFIESGERLPFEIERVYWT
ncbi:MAG: FdtA/QdtA family cupin domain-containing protein, partial [Muribaculaceae bacterium]|nr:FdtA/QdtA family cupin domain-containing protein [Muribaculaceae bacterium]